MKVLILNHTGEMSGAERSLLQLLAGLPKEISVTVACPDGPLAGATRAIGLPVVPVPGIRGSLRLHPWHTARGLCQLVAGALVVRRRAGHAATDVIHANSIRSALVATTAARLGGPRVVAHVHDCLPRGRAADAVKRLTGSGAWAVIANSRYTAENFTAASNRAPVRVLSYPVDCSRFDPRRIDRVEARRRLGLDPSSPLLGVIAQITPWKGQDDAIRALALVKRNWSTARLLLVGETKFRGGAERYDNAAYSRRLQQLTRDVGVADSVLFLGEREDVPEILRALDVLLIPSWEEPFGITMIEAMAMSVPVVATNVGGPPEIITQLEDGILLPPRQPQRWAATINGLLADPGLRETMGRRARQKASLGFTPSAYVASILRVWAAAAVAGEGERG